MIVNNLTGTNSIGSNCEEDKSIALLNNIDELLLNYKKLPTKEIQNEDEILETVVFDQIFAEEELDFVEEESISNASSVVCQKLLKLTDCSECKRKLQAPSAVSERTSNLDITLPSQMFKRYFKNIFCGANLVIPYLCSEVSLMKKVKSYIDPIQVSEIGCLKHDIEMSMKLKQCTVHYALIKFCKNINSFLSGKTTVLPSFHNHIQELAYEFRLKRKRIGKYSDIFTE